MEEVYEFLNECGAYYLATTDGDQPRVRPFATLLIFEDKLYIQTGKAKNVSKQMMKNPKIMRLIFFKIQMNQQIGASY